MKDTDTSRLCICHPPSRIGGANSAMKGAIVCLTNWSKIIRVAHMQSGSRIRRDQIADALVNMVCLQCSSLREVEFVDILAKSRTHY